MANLILQLESFRYRVDDVKRAVTKVAIKEARLAEIKQEVSTHDPGDTYAQR